MHSRPGVTATTKLGTRLSQMPLVVDTASGAGLSGLSRRSFSEGGSAASANNMAVLPFEL